MQDQDVIQEFLVESYENLSRLDQELVELEKHPTDAALLASISRTIHTIKGTCGFLAFSTLERMSHQAAKAVTNMMMVASSMTPAQVHPSQRSRTPLRGERRTANGGTAHSNGKNGTLLRVPRGFLECF